MTWKPIRLCAKHGIVIVILSLPFSLWAQDAQAPPVSYASMSQLNGMLSQLEQTSQSTQIDLAKLRIERWKTDSGTKKQLQSDVDSLARNLRYALPDILAQLRAAPENVAVTFKLYRNVGALYDVLSSVVESAGAFGPADDYQTLAADLTALDQSRRAVGDRMENLSTEKEAELTHLRTDLRQAEAQIHSAPPKKVIVDDAEPAKPKHHSTTRKKTTQKKEPQKPKSSPQETSGSGK